MHLCLGKKAFQSGANLTAETFDRLLASIPSWGRGQPSTFLSINISKRSSRILAQNCAKNRLLNPSVMGCQWVLWQWWWSCPYMKCTYSKISQIYFMFMFIQKIDFWIHLNLGLVSLSFVRNGFPIVFIFKFGQRDFYSARPRNVATIIMVPDLRF